MNRRDAIKQEAVKAQDSADDLRSIVAKMDPETKSRVQNDLDTIRESVGNIRTMLQEAGSEEV
ncbi:MAG: hypothetical protein M1514_01890 [Patescibacteria group bacterium]|nr:hypothetical protein [Patescibacteria group bacterium]